MLFATTIVSNNVCQNRAYKKSRRGNAEAYVVKVSRKTVDPATTLRKAIETGHFLPGQRLTEIELAEWLGINRVNVKMALGKLDQEGLVEVERNKGARVRVIGEQEAVEIMQTYASLEVLIARNAAAKATAADHMRLKTILEAIKTAQAEDDFGEYTQQVGRLHGEIRRIAAHATASRIVSTLNVQIARFRLQSMLFPTRIKRSIPEFEEIVGAILAADGVRAGKAMQDHLNNVAKALEQNLAMARL